MRIPLFLTLLVYSGNCRPTQPSITVDTPRGRVIGFSASFSPNIFTNHSSSGNVYQGIPFALPPIDKRRFKKPQPISSYGSQPLEAKELRPACAQLSSMPMSEDCLYLNVITPSIPSSQLYPVMIYIHGGSFNSGSARNFDYEGLIRNLVRHGVIVVTIQYRLGALGFFNTGTDDFPANLGLFDQIEALRWVQSEIRSFGGDPKRVTLFGNSAGASSISAHTYSNISRGLFHSVIQESGSILTCLDGALGSTDPSRDFAQKMCNFISSDWERGDFSRLHNCLDTMDTKQMTAYDKGSLTGWKMVVDSSFLSSSPQQLAPFRQKIPVMIGSMRDEFEYFLSQFQQNLPNGADLFSIVTAQIIQDRTQQQELLPLITMTYLKDVGNDAVARDKATSDALTAAAFVAPMQRDIRNWMKYGNFDVYIYEMSYPSHVLGFQPIGDWNPAVHTGEVPYVSDASNVWNKALANNWTTPSDFELIEWMGTAWTNFAKTGVPDAAWAPVSRNAYKLPYLSISSSGRRMEQDYRSNDELFWNVKVPQIVGDLPKQKVSSNPKVMG